MTTRYKSGKVSVILADGLAEWTRSLLDAAEAATVELLEAEATEVMLAAKARWYKEVERETGKSGDLETVTTFSSDGSVVVGVRSRDTRMQGGKPVAAMVHQPMPLSRVKVRVSREEYGRIKKGPKPRDAWKSRQDGHFYALKPNKGASDGQPLFLMLVRKPLLARVPKITAQLGERIVARHGGA